MESSAIAGKAGKKRQQRDNLQVENNSHMQ